MVSWTQVAVFLPAALLVAISPGANNVLAMQHGMRAGVSEAIVALSGRLLAFAIMLTLAVAGLTAALTRSQAVFDVVKWAGVVYLTYLGVRSFLGRGETKGVDAGDAGGRVARARREFLTVAANPKALLLFTAFLPQFVDPTSSVATQLLVLGPLYIALELVTATGWAYLGHRLGCAGLGRRARRRLDRAVGTTFVGLAGALATTRR